MESRREVEDLLNQLESLDWFSCVGQSLAVQPPRIWSVSRVGSWSEALSVLSSRETEEFLVESQNDLYEEHRQRTAQTKPKKVLVTEFNGWVSARRGRLLQVVDKACRSSTIPADVGDKYRSRLEWMIGQACTILQYDEYIVENRLYCYVLDLLKAGHCGCGWTGEYPAGSLVVF